MKKIRALIAVLVEIAEITELSGPDKEELVIEMLTDYAETYQWPFAKFWIPIMVFFIRSAVKRLKTTDEFKSLKGNADRSNELLNQANSIVGALKFHEEAVSP